MTLDYILNKYGLNADQKCPIEIPNVGRNDLAGLFAELGFKEGAEIGVEAGVYSEVLCRAGLKLHCVDLWSGYEGYKKGDANMQKNYEDAQRRLKAYDCRFWVMRSTIAAAQFPDQSLDFVYIDANHDLFHVIQDITVWLPKIRKGGIIAGHDYCDRIMKRGNKRVKNTTHHVIEAVNAYTKAYAIHPWFVLGRKEAREGEIRDKNRSWMWVHC